jgi:tetratricopeptide (TPR) repeat protein
MVVDPRRDHSLRIPRPDLSVRLGTPNACNGCHTRPEEDASWAAAKVVEWYGPRRPDDPHYAVALHAGRTRSPDASQQLGDLLKRRNTPDIVRATAIELLSGTDDPASVDAVRKSLNDPSPLVRASASRVVPSSSPAEALERLGGLLHDPSRLVRTSAAVRLASVPPRLMMPDRRLALQQALQEYEIGQRANDDRAACHLNLGNLYQQLGRIDDARAAFRTAVRLEPYLTGPRSNLAALLETAAPQEALRLRREEHELMARDASLLPDNAVVQHRYGLSSYMMGRYDDACKALEEACRLDVQSYNYRLALTLLYEKLGQWSHARRSAELLDEIRPGDRVARDLLERIRRQSDTE